MSALEQVQDAQTRETDAPRMRHFAVPPLFDVGFCGTPRDGLPLSFGGEVDCVVCAEMWAAYVGRDQ